MPDRPDRTGKPYVVAATRVDRCPVCTEHRVTRIVLETLRRGPIVVEERRETVSCLCPRPQR